MQRYFSPETGGFFSEDVHGARQLDLEGVATPNPDCMIPADAIAITDVLWHRLLIATSEGKAIEVVDGEPVAVVPSAVDETHV